MAKTYEDTHRMSVEEPEEFWAAEAEKLHWYGKWDKVLDDGRPPFYRWFVGGETNICYNAVDRHALGDKKDRPAVIWESPETGLSRILTFGELYNEVNHFAAALKALGVQKGDRVIIYLPMVPEALVAMLACVRIGAVHSVVFAGFSKTALAERIDDAQPKLLIAADAGKRRGKAVPLKQIVDGAIDEAKFKVEKVIMLDRGIHPFRKAAGRDYDWNDLMKEHGKGIVEPERMLSTDPSYILYTSGTTGKPKGVVRDTGGYMVALHTSMQQIYDCGQDDVYWATSDIGWVVGHSYIVYAPLLYGIPTVVFEGTPDYPNPGIWWSIIEKHKVSVVFSAPTAIRILRKFPEKWMKEHDLSSLRYFFLAGEPLDKPTWKWADANLGVPVIDHYWQTESGWSILANHAGIELLPIKPGSPTKAAMGYRLDVVDGTGKKLPAGQKGYLVAHPPLPPGMLMTIWGDDKRYVNSYWKGPGYPDRLLYVTGDFAVEDEDGYFFMLGRADEVINVAGHRLGTREVEEVISGHPAVAEVSAIGIADEIKGQAIAAFIVVKQGIEVSSALADEIKKHVRDSIGPVAVPSVLQFIKALPKTRSGKILRRVLKALCEKADLGDLSTIEDGATVGEIRQALRDMGIEE